MSKLVYTEKYPSTSLSATSLADTEYVPSSIAALSLAILSARTSEAEVTAVLAT